MSENITNNHVNNNYVINNYITNNPIISNYISGVTFIVLDAGKKYHTADDWGLVLCEAPTRNAPEPDRDIIQVPGGNGYMDVTEAVFGFIPYKSRTISMRFMNYRNGAAKRTSDRSKVYNTLHGRKVHIIFDDDKSFYYDGIVNVMEHSPELHRDIIGVTADCQPYKMELTTTLEPWLWDPFAFHGGVIHRSAEFKNIQISGAHTFTIVSRRMEASPKFIVSNITSGDTLTVTYNGIDYQIQEGVTVIPQIILREGVNTLNVVGSGTISIEYRGGEL